MNEAQTEFEYIDPALRKAGWGTVEESYVKKQYPIDQGRLLGSGRRKQPLKADYVLIYKNRRLAVIEAKARDIYYTEGVGQAKDYAERLDIRFTYSTNGLEIYRIDMEEGTEGDVAHYPTPQELWDMTFPPPINLIEEHISSWKERLMNVPFVLVNGRWQPRYYQQVAISRVIDAICEGKKRILLTMATGTGKTGTAFQICWKLFQAKWNLRHDGKRLPRILFLADRNILADQAFNSFNAFDEDALVRISPAEIRKSGKVPKNGSIFFTIFQTFIAGDVTEDGGSADSPSFVSSSSFVSSNTKKGKSEALKTEGSASSPSFVSSNTKVTELVEGNDATKQNSNLKEITCIDIAKAYMYILECADGSFYTGSTKDLNRRLEQHKMGEGANHTRKRLPVKLVYYEVSNRIDEAFYREKQIQGWTRAKKIALINGDIELLKKLSKSKSEALKTEGSAGSPSFVSSKTKVGELVEPTDATKKVKGYFGEYPKDFFDFIIVDECHRGGANDESTWREILNHFSPAVQLGLTATPKRDVNTDTYKYFGEPIYTYSLNQGIEDGFLTPFRVKKIDTTLDEYTFVSDDVVVVGEIQEGRTYTENDFNRIIEIKEREEYRVKLFMSMIDQNQKTLVFCATQVHAAAIRDLINQHAQSKNPNYCHRVTAHDLKIGEQHLREFQDNEKSIPTILTTSRKLSTGVDAPEIRNIVLMRPIKSMVEFKQIVGRGTRLFEGKDYFTVYDFVNAHAHFKDDEWDGPPQDPEPKGPPKAKKPCKECGELVCICEQPELEACTECGNLPCVCDNPKSKMIKVKLADHKVRELDSMVKTTFWSPDGKPISAEEFLQRLYGDLPSLIKDEAELRKIWSLPNTRKKLMEELEERGYTEAYLEDLRHVVQGDDKDMFDVLSYVAYSKEMLPRNNRAAKAKIQLSSYNAAQQEFLNFVLEQYVSQGVKELSDTKLSTLLELKYHSVEDAKEVLGSVADIRDTFIGFQEYLYAS